MRALGGEGPEVPLTVVVGSAGIGSTLLGVDEGGELGGVPDEENRCVVADQVVVAFLRVEFQGEAPGVSNSVRKTLLTGDGREAGHHRRACALLQEVGLAPLTYVLGGLKESESPVALGVHHMFGNPFPIEVGHLLQ